ncbi:MAG: SDR family oxidoreductase [Melioribacteraceae bacterium]|nr:MAG: SDR family oxidoreductase [Melioribacteraceae bacterium]
MNSLKNKIVFITGATAGIGKSTAVAFAKEGAKLILTARRADVLKILANELKKEFNVEIFTAKLDVKNLNEAKKVIAALPEEWKSIDILVNNAGLAKGFGHIYTDDEENWDEMIDTNIKGVLYVTRQILPGMIERGSGHIINLGSTAGHMSYANGGVYCATKFGVRAISDALRIELLDKNVRVSSVDPGAVETEFSNTRFNGDKEKAKNVYKGITPLNGDDIAEAIIFCATRPPHANINEIIITPSVQANSFFIHRK